MKVHNWKANRKQESKNRLGTFDLELSNGMTLIGCSVAVNSKDELFVGLPQRSWKSGNETKYQACVSINGRERREKFNVVTIDLLKAGGWV